MLYQVVWVLSGLNSLKTPIVYFLKRSCYGEIILWLTSKVRGTLLCSLENLIFKNCSESLQKESNLWLYVPTPKNAIIVKCLLCFTIWKCYFLFNYCDWELCWQQLFVPFVLGQGSINIIRIYFCFIGAKTQKHNAGVIELSFMKISTSCLWQSENRTNSKENGPFYGKSPVCVNKVHF